MLRGKVTVSAGGALGMHPEPEGVTVGYVDNGTMLNIRAIKVVSGRTWYKIDHPPYRYTTRQAQAATLSADRWVHGGYVHIEPRDSLDNDVEFD